MDFLLLWRASALLRIRPSFVGEMPVFCFLPPMTSSAFNLWPLGSLLPLPPVAICLTPTRPHAQVKEKSENEINEADLTKSNESIPDYGWTRAFRRLCASTSTPLSQRHKSECLICRLSDVNGCLRAHTRILQSMCVDLHMSVCVRDCTQGAAG